MTSSLLELLIAANTPQSSKRKIQTLPCFDFRIEKLHQLRFWKASDLISNFTKTKYVFSPSIPIKENGISFRLNISQGILSRSK